MMALYEVVKYLLYLEMGICVIYMNEIMPKRLSDDRGNFRPLQHAHTTETVHPIAK